MMRIVWAWLVALLFLPARVWAQDSSFDATFVYEAEQALSHRIGYANGEGWAVNTTYSAGHMAYGPYATTWGQGGGKAVFRMMIDNRSADNGRVLTVDVFDADTNEILATRDIRRQEFDQTFTYQDFELWFELRSRIGHRMETRVYWHDTAYINLDKVTVYLDGFQAGLPELVNKSKSSDARATALMERAIRGLGFDSAAFDGPNAGDLVFVGRYYMAWIDQTGFDGKMNALWVLNGAEGDALDFVHLDPSNNRPVSFLGVAEDGDGRWLAGYRGAEHFEVPHEVPEPGEDRNGNGQCDVDESCTGASCQRSICNWYSMNEAAPITDPDVPNWSSCNANRMTWARKTAPVQTTSSETSLKLVYEGPLVKGADAAKDGAYDGDNCHRDYLFQDGIRRRVYLRVGYVLHGDRDYFDRTYQFRNPAGNPAFGNEAWSLIGGLVITKYPTAQSHKAELFRTLQPDNDMTVNGKTYSAGTWTVRERLKAGENEDDVWAWLKTPISWSARGRFSQGDSLRMEHMGPSDNDDVGFCICRVHGGYEIGGGVLHREKNSLPIGTDSLSIETTRRISLPSLYNPPFVYEAESSLLGKQIGRADSDGWSASTALDAAGRLIYGPYAYHWGDGAKTALFRMMVDNITAGGDVVTVDAYDASAGQVVASRVIPRSAFNEPFVHKEIALPFNLDGRLGHAIETRVWWHDTSYVRIDNVKVLDGTVPPGQVIYQAEQSELAKVIGRREEDGWSASTASDSAGRLLYGPYATTWGAGLKTAVFRMMVDNVSADQYVVASIDVYDATANQVLASRQVRRNEFSTPRSYADFSLDFSLQGRSGHAIETRLWWHDISYLKVDKVTVFDR
jgi:hypothetical protein